MIRNLSEKNFSESLRQSTLSLIATEHSEQAKTTMISITVCAKGGSKGILSTVHGSNKASLYTEVLHKLCKSYQNRLNLAKVRVLPDILPQPASIDISQL